MKIRTKLIVFITLLAILPIVIVNVYSYKKFVKTSADLNQMSTLNVTENQADSINFYFGDIIASAKEIASSDQIRSFTEKSNSSDFTILDTDEEYIEITNKLNTLTECSSFLEKVMIINNSGMIIASTNELDTGKSMSNYKGLFNLASTNNGISSFFIGGEDNNVPVFIVAKAIYSYDSQCLGIVYHLYNTGYLQNLINSSNYNKYTTCAIMDNTGHILEYPYKTLKSYTEDESFKHASPMLLNVLTAEGNTDAYNPVYSFGENTNARTVFASNIPANNWSVLAITNDANLNKEISRETNNQRNLSIILIILSCVAMVMFVIVATKPINEIMKVFRKKQKGDTSARFDIRSNDEFRLIGNAFNDLFDDVFESEQRYRTIVEITNNIVFEINFEKNSVFVSKNFNKKFSHRAKDDTVKESFLYKLRLHKDDKDRYMTDLDRVLGPANTMQGEYRVKSIYGDFIWIMIKATKFYNREERPTKIVGVIMDIDKEKRSEMHLLQRASYDALTQLLNRETFIKTLDAELDNSAYKKSLDALMFIDLDDFKFFNDEYGHACGDEVLKFVADTLKEVCFERGFAGRLGGDEFVACLTNLTLYGDSGKIAQEVLDILSKGFISDSTGLKLTIHASIGIAFLRESGKNSEEIIAAADEAMYNIKKHGKSAYAYAKAAQKHALSDAEIIDNNLL
ncbi:MAG: diguanylate cyclase [Oscillospiraceae bacterium]|nr:diguanylate cyclase [Oscillospiraceae bacterium]